MRQDGNPNESHGLKQALRRTLKEQRTALTPEDRKRHHLHIAAHLEDLLVQRSPLPVSYTHLTLPTNREV